MEIKEKNNNETANEGSQTINTISPCMDAAVYPKSRRALLPLSATDVTIPFDSDAEQCVARNIAH